MVETTGRPEYRATMTTAYKNTTGMCMELYHQVLGTSPGTLTLTVRDEDLQEVVLHEARALTSDWMRMYVLLPPGVHQVIVEGTRASDGSSGIAVDDIRIAQCSSFGLYS